MGVGVGVGEGWLLKGGKLGVGQDRGERFTWSAVSYAVMLICNWCMS